MKAQCKEPPFTGLWECSCVLGLYPSSSFWFKGSTRSTILPQVRSPGPAEVLVGCTLVAAHFPVASMQAACVHQHEFIYVRDVSV